MTPLEDIGTMITQENISQKIFSTILTGNRQSVTPVYLYQELPEQGFQIYTQIVLFNLDNGPGHSTSFTFETEKKLFLFPYYSK